MSQLAHFATAQSPAMTMRPPGAEVSAHSPLPPPLPPLIEVTLRDPTDTIRRNGQIRKSHLRFLPTTERSRSCHRCLIKRLRTLATRSGFIGSIVAHLLTREVTHSNDSGQASPAAVRAVRSPERGSSPSRRD